MDWFKLIMKDWDKYYHQYIQSDEWKEKRRQVFERDGYLCICGRKSTVIHHKHYKNIGKEPLSDLISLCEECHFDLHAKIKDIRGW